MVHNQNTASQGKVTLTNEQVRLEFALENRGLAAMIDLGTDFDHCQAVTGQHTLWQITLAQGTSKTALANGTQQAFFQWQGLDLPGESQVISVTMVIELPRHSGIASDAS